MRWGQAGWWWFNNIVCSIRWVSGDRCRRSQHGLTGLSPLSAGGSPRRWKALPHEEKATWQVTEEIPVSGCFASEAPVNFVPVRSFLLSGIAIRYKITIRWTWEVPVQEAQTFPFCTTGCIWLFYVVGVSQFPISWEDFFFWTAPHSWHLIPAQSELLQSLSGRSQNGVPTDDIAEDEDLLNVALWHPSCKSHQKHVKSHQKPWFQLQSVGRSSGLKVRPNLGVPWRCSPGIVRYW